MEDPSDGPLKDHRLVTYYGTPASEHMGILGQLEPEAYITKLKEQTQVYSDLDPDRPAVPTIELITTMAQNEPGPDGDYVRMTSEENIETYVELAKKHDALVLLDIQLGKDTVMEQVKMVEKWLKLPMSTWRSIRNSMWLTGRNQVKISARLTAERSRRPSTICQRSRKEQPAG